MWAATHNLRVPSMWAGPYNLSALAMWLCHNKKCNDAVGGWGVSGSVIVNVGTSLGNLYTIDTALVGCMDNYSASRIAPGSQICVYEKMRYQARKMMEGKALLLASLKERQENDPLRTFEPFGVQRLFIESVLSRKYRENYYIGANRSGKSDAGAYTGSHLARFGYSEVKFVKGQGSSIAVRDRATSGWVSAVDFPTSRDTIQPKYFDNGFVPPGVTHEPFIPKREVDEWRVSDQILKLKNGSIIGFKSADSGRIKYQGAEKDWIHFDEEHPESIYEECIIRVGANPLTLFTTCTLLPPEGIVGGITWLFNKIVKPWKSGDKDDVCIFNASIYDNPHIPIPEIQALEARFPQGSAQRRIRLNGELVAGLSGARVYSGFTSLLNVRKQPEIVLRRPLCWVWDFNVEPMVCLLGQRERALFRVFAEIVLEEGNLQEMCDAFKRLHPYHMAEVWVYGDASGTTRTAQTKMSSYQIILNNMKDYPAPIRMKVPDKNPSIADRVNAVNRICKNEEGVIELEIDPTCGELIDDLEQVIGDGKQGIKKTFNKKDPYYKRTHTSDALGYWVFQEAPIKPLGMSERTRKITIKRPGYRASGAPAP